MLAISEVAMDMDDFLTEDGRLYYNTNRRKGYVLILEARNNRNGKDVQNVNARNVNI